MHRHGTRTVARPLAAAAAFVLLAATWAPAGIVKVEVGVSGMF